MFCLRERRWGFEIGRVGFVSHGEGNSIGFRAWLSWVSAAETPTRRAARSGRTGHASWNRAYPRPRSSDLRVRPYFSADVYGVEDRAGQADQSPFVQQPENLCCRRPRTPAALPAGRSR